MSHIVHVIPGIDRIGGAERQVILLAGGMARRGWRSTVLALSGDGGDRARKLQAAGVEFLSLGMRQGLADPRGWLRMRGGSCKLSRRGACASSPRGVDGAAGADAAPVRVVVDTVHTAVNGFGPQARSLPHDRSTGRLRLRRKPSGGGCLHLGAHG